MARVVVSRLLPEAGLEPLVAGGHELVVPVGAARFDRAALLEALADADALVCLLTERVDAELLDAAPRLLVVGNVAVGYDNVDLEAATRAGVAVCNTPGVLDETVADLAFALVLQACRRLSEAEADLRAGRWKGWDVDQYLGQDVHGATLGLVGYGRIARAVARRAQGFAMTVLHHARRPTGAEGYLPELEELLARSDVVSLHVPLTEDTYHLIDARRLSFMKPTAVLVNTSRGPVVDEEALATALDEGRLFAAGLDVYEHEPLVHPRLLASPRVVLLPHVGSASVATRTAMVRLAATGVATVLAGGVPETVLNPEVLTGGGTRPHTGTRGAAPPAAGAAPPAARSAPPAGGSAPPA
jgi:glyoxylate reductase